MSCSSPRKSLVKGERFIRGLKRNQSWVKSQNWGSLWRQWNWWKWCVRVVLVKLPKTGDAIIWVSVCVWGVHWDGEVLRSSQVFFWFIYRGIARTQSPTNKNYAPESYTFGMIASVNPTEVQWRGLSLGEPPCRSRSPLCQVSMLESLASLTPMPYPQQSKVVCKKLVSAGPSLQRHATFSIYQKLTRYICSNTIELHTRAKTLQKHIFFNGKPTFAGQEFPQSYAVWEKDIFAHCYFCVDSFFFADEIFSLILNCVSLYSLQVPYICTFLYFFGEKIAKKRTYREERCHILKCHPAVSRVLKNSL